MLCQPLVWDRPHGPSPQGGRERPGHLTCPRSTRCTSRHWYSSGTLGTQSTRGGCSPCTRPPGSAEAPARAGSVHTTSLCTPGSRSLLLSTGDAASASSVSCGPESQMIRYGWMRGQMPDTLLHGEGANSTTPGKRRKKGFWPPHNTAVWPSDLTQSLRKEAQRFSPRWNRDEKRLTSHGCWEDSMAKPKKCLAQRVQPLVLF